MSRRLKLLSVIFSLIFCFSVCTLSVYAVGEDGVGEVDPGYSETPVEPAPPVVDPGSDIPSDYPSSDISYEPSYDDPDPVPQSSDTSSYIEYSNNDDYSSSYYYNNNTDYSSSYQDDNYVAAPASDVEPQSADPSVELYDVKKTVDGKELNSKDWEDIAASLKNAGSASGDDGDDFSFIKNNNSSSDNGDWMLYVGIALIVLSVVGVAYVIISNVNNHKKAKAGSYVHTSAGKGRATATAGASRYADDYNDNYRPQSRSPKVSAERRSKFDTADITIPRHNSSSKGGRRYK